MQITSIYSTLVNPPGLAITQRLALLPLYFPHFSLVLPRSKKIKKTIFWALSHDYNFDQSDCWALNKTDNLFQSHASRFGDTTAAPTASTARVKTTVFTQPWPLDSLPNIVLQYLSASLKNAWRATSTPPLNAFSFCKLKQLK